MKDEEAPAYNLWDITPSSVVDAPNIIPSLLREDLMTVDPGRIDYSCDDYFICTELEYRQAYPRLFSELGALAVVKVHNPGILDDIDGTMKHYYMGATLTLVALKTEDKNAYTDLTYSYQEQSAKLDATAREYWLASMQAAEAITMDALKYWVYCRYDWQLEPQYMKVAMRIGAQFAYTLLAHNAACLKVENDISWLTKEDEVFAGWAEYRANNYK